MGGILSLLTAARLRPRAVINLDGGLPATDHALTAHAIIRRWLDETDFRVRLAGTLREAFFLPSERDGRCEEIIRTMCAAPDSVLRFLPEQVGALDPARILSRSDCSCPVYRSSETALQPCEGIFFADSPALRTNRRIRPLLAHLRIAACSESRERFPTNSF